MPKTPLELLAAASVIPLPATTGASSVDSVGHSSVANSIASVINNGTNGGETRLNSLSTTSTKSASGDGEQLLPADPPPSTPAASSGTSPVSSAGPKQTSGMHRISMFPFTASCSQ